MFDKRKKERNTTGIIRKQKELNDWSYEFALVNDNLKMVDFSGIKKIIEQLCVQNQTVSIPLSSNMDGSLVFFLVFNGIWFFPEYDGTWEFWNNFNFLFQIFKK